MKMGRRWSSSSDWAVAFRAGESYNVYIREVIYSLVTKGFPFLKKKSRAGDSKYSGRRWPFITLKTRTALKIS